MIGMPMGDINRGQIVAALGDPIRQSPRLLRREKGIDEDSVSLARDERRRIGYPCSASQFFLTGRQIATRALYGEHVPFKVRAGHGGDSRIRRNLRPGPWMAGTS